MVIEGAAPAIDTHAHVFVRGMAFAADAHSRPDYDYGVDRWLADLDMHGIAYGVIAAASLFDDANAYTLAVLEAHRARLRGTVIVPPTTDAASLRRLVEGGVVGVRLTWRRLDELPDLRADPWRGFLQRLTDAGLHVELLGRGASLPRILPALVEAGVRVVVDHLGVPSRDAAERRAGTETLLRAVEGGRVWIKLSAGFRMTFGIAAETAARLVADAGPSRLLWGSDAPFVNHESSVTFGDTIRLYHRLVPDPATRAAIDRTGIDLFFNRGLHA